MNAEQLAQIKARADKATAGEWGYVPTQGYSELYLYGESGQEGVAAEVFTEADAEFIAKARVDIPTLVAEVERLQKRLNKAEARLRVIGQISAKGSEVFGCDD